MTWSNLHWIGKAVCVAVALVGVLATIDLAKNISGRGKESKEEKNDGDSQV